MQLQIFLDSRKFGPGVVDGQPGEFTAKALALYRHSKGLPEEARPDLEGISPYTTYEVTAADLAAIGTMAEEPAEIAKQKRLPYSGLGELLGERFHTTRAFIAELNPKVTVDALAAGAVVKVPNVARPFHADKFPAAYSKAGASASRSVLVDTRLRLLEVRESGRLIAAFPITPGSTEHPAPVGEWKVA
ncbi:MAG TPA: L,D-transpeptidase, partial [Chthoniobacterales bacterium]